MLLKLEFINSVNLNFFNGLILFRTNLATISSRDESPVEVYKFSRLIISISELINALKVSDKYHESSSYTIYHIQYNIINGAWLRARIDKSFTITPGLIGLVDVFCMDYGFSQQV